MKKMKFVKGCLKFALFILCALPKIALAQGVPVYDNANLVQSILEAARALRSNINEAKQIANQVTSLSNELKNLTKLPLSIVDEFNDQLKIFLRQ